MAWIKRAAVGDALHLNNDDATAVSCRRGHGKVVQGQAFPLHGDVASRIGGGTAQKRHVDSHRWVK